MTTRLPDVVHWNGITASQERKELVDIHHSRAERHRSEPFRVEDQEASRLGGAVG